MSDLHDIPFESGQIVVLGAGPDDARRWYRTSVRRVDARIVWLSGTTEDLAPVDVLPGEPVTCHTWRYMDALYRAQGQVAFTQVIPESLIGLTITQSERIQQREYVRIPITAVATGVFLGSAG